MNAVLRAFYEQHRGQLSMTELSFDEIRLLATQTGELEWREFAGYEQEILAHYCLGYGHAWMFFRNADITIPERASMRLCAIVVSKFGEVRRTADFSPDYSECMAYLKKMSDHFVQRGL